MRCHRSPAMQTLVVQHHISGITQGHLHPHLTCKAARQWHASLIDCYNKLITFHPHGTWPASKLCLRPRNIALATLSHGPAPRAAVKRNVDGTMMIRITHALSPCPGIIGRENAAHKSNDGQAMCTIITQRINIPPAIAILGNYRVEARSCNSASAARMPESAAIGTPGPGCTLPPARYNPGTFVRACGR
jgi:hypothetical protein